MSATRKIRLPELHVTCEECGRVFASLADRKAHYKMMGGEQVCLHPQHGYLRMYYARGAWRRRKDS